MLSEPMTGHGMDLPRLLAIARARRWLIVGMVVVATVLALVGSLAKPSRYEASADLLFGRTTNSDAIVAEGATETTVAPDREAATNLALASLDNVAARVEQRLRGLATVDEIRDAVTIKAQRTSDVATITAEWTGPDQAAALANAFASEIVAQRRQAERNDIQQAIDALQATVPQDPETAGERLRATSLLEKVSELEYLKARAEGNVRLVERATPPDHRSSPTPVRNGLIAGFVAAVLGLFLIVLLARFDDGFRDEDELAELMETSVLTRVPDVERSRYVWTPHEDRAFLESFEFLRLNLQLMGREGDSLVVAVTSPGPSEGKTTVVSWLARALSLSGDEVVAVDLDLRKPELHTYLNADGEPGTGVLEALLSSATPETSATAEAIDDVGDDRSRGRRAYSGEDIEAGLDELARLGGNARRAARSLEASGRDISEPTLRRWKDVYASLYGEIRAARIRGILVAPQLRLLAGDRHPELRAGLIARGRLRQLFEELAQDADWVLVDTVPVSTAADATAVAAAADGVILVVDFQRARRRDLLAAKRQLANARAELLGIVLNRAAVDLSVYSHSSRSTRSLDAAGARQEDGPMRGARTALS
jgi:Mrp family chromosome partitioning ATPase/capsular polysaccharide biosynthesis protein